MTSLLFHETPLIWLILGVSDSVQRVLSLTRLGAFFSNTRHMRRQRGYQTNSKERQGYHWSDALQRPQPKWKYTVSTQHYPLKNLDELQEQLDKRLSRSAQLEFAKFVKSEIEDQPAQYSFVSGLCTMVSTNTVRLEPNSLERCGQTLSCPYALWTLVS